MIVPVSGKVYGTLEKQYAHEAVEDGWLTSGRWCRGFEKRLREFTGRREVILCNSGSSANLLAISALELEPGDEVITMALNFPTTVNPILQNGLVPVFVDVTLPEMVVDVSQLEAALSPKTKAVIFAHTLGYPFDVKAVRAFCDKHQLWMVEDCCDALGTKTTGEYGDCATYSFYPAHQITTGEGGAVTTNSPRLGSVIRSFRDWGRDCWCETGQDNTCGRRFRGEYDHKYTYSRIGYNLKMDDIQAAIGCAQMERLPEFVKKRAENHANLWALFHLANLGGYFQTTGHTSEYSWFGFSLICRDGVNRNDLCRWLDGQGVANRPVFAGNILRQPAYKNIKHRQIGGLHNTNVVHERAFWIGCWPGLTTEQLDYAVSKIKEYVCQKS